MVLMLICFSMAVVSSKSIVNTELSEVISLTEPMNGKQAGEIQKQEKETEIPFRFTMFGMEKSQFIRNADLFRDIQTDVIHISGDSNLVLPSDSILMEEDKEGCLIDEKLAQDLFGSLNVRGQSIQYLGKDYIVRGVISGTEKVFMIQTDSKTKEILNKVSVEIPSEDKRNEILNALSARHGFPSQGMKIYVYAGWGRSLITIIGIIFGLGVAIPAFKRSIAMKQYPVYQYLGILYGVAVLLCFLWVVGFQFKINMNIIPSKWSDFDYWSRFAEERKEQLLLLLRGEKLPLEMIYIQSFLETCKYSLFTLILYVVGVSKLKIDTVWELFFTVILSFAGSFIGVILSAQYFSYTASDDKAIWFLAVFYLCGKYFTSLLFAEKTVECNNIMQDCG